MSKLLKLGGIFLGLGLVLFLGLHLMAGGRIFNRTDDKAVAKQASFAAAEISQLDIDLPSDNAEVTGTDQDTVTVDYNETDRSSYMISAESGVLRIKQTVRSDFQLFIFDWAGFQERKTRISLPRDLLKKLKLDLGSGKAELSQLNLQGSADLHVSSGDMELSHLSIAKESQIRLESGSLKVSDLTMAGDSQIRVNSGEMDASDFTAEKLTIRVDSGGLNLKNTTVSAPLDISANSGSVQLDRLTIGQEARIKVDSGNVSGSLTGRMEDYSISAHAASGETSLPKSTTGGSKTLTVDADSGDINIRFEE